MTERNGKAESVNETHTTNGERQQHDNEKTKQQKANGGVETLKEAIHPADRTTEQQKEPIARKQKPADGRNRARNGGDVLSSVCERVKSREPAVQHNAGFGPGVLGLVPGCIAVLAGEAGVGKSSLAMACVFDMLTADRTLRAAVANVELSDEVLVQRELSRASGVPFGKILDNDLTDEEMVGIAAIQQELRTILDRVTFLPEPFDGHCLTAHRADILIVDYIQELHRPPGMPPREAVENSMRSIRRLAKGGVCAIVVAQLSRSTAATSASTMDRLKESGQIGYDAHNVYALRAARGGHKLIHAKNRNGPLRNLLLHFDATTHHWSLADEERKAVSR